MLKVRINLTNMLTIGLLVNIYSEASNNDTSGHFTVIIIYIAELEAIAMSITRLF